MPFQFVQTGADLSQKMNGCRMQMFCLFVYWPRWSRTMDWVQANRLNCALWSGHPVKYYQFPVNSLCIHFVYVCDIYSDVVVVPHYYATKCSRGWFHGFWPSLFKYWHKFSRCMVLVSQIRGLYAILLILLDPSCPSITQIFKIFIKTKSSIEIGQPDLISRIICMCHLIIEEK